MRFARDDSLARVHPLQIHQELVRNLFVQPSRMSEQVLGKRPDVPLVISTPSTLLLVSSPRIHDLTRRSVSVRWSVPRAYHEMCDIPLNLSAEEAVQHIYHLVRGIGVLHWELYHLM